VSTSTLSLEVSFGGRRWRADIARAVDLSIPLHFDGDQPRFFGAPAAHAQSIEAGNFVGDVRRGGSVNCATYSLVPHCNGTHTECIGHVTSEPVSVRELARDHLIPAEVVSITPESAESTEETSRPTPAAGDRLITQRALRSSTHALIAGGALIIRTLPNDPVKQHRDYDADGPAPYFTAEAMQWIVSHDIHHLVVDLPSIDRAADEGRLTAHRLFWGMPPGSTTRTGATRSTCTITELAYIDDTVADGMYLLNLQVAPFMADAAPSRPVLYPLIPA
jgi:kynurenine formamidase